MKIVNKSQILAKLQTEYENLHEVQALKQHATQYVPGKGSLNSSVAIIGEAPGGTEDQKGEPFVGPAGRVLNKLLDLVQRNRDQLWITNVVKYRPENNRTPKQIEIEASRRFLLEELKAIRIKHVILMGRSSMTAMGVENPIVSQLHGTTEEKIYGKRTLKLHFTYHPAAALRNADHMEILKADFQTIFQRITEDGS